ncbi:MAG: UDP-N-acetylglucosamine--N-acetylmuramyl-(pentapeptide) pyrophosphoryl-undecaprenol N-acetylglucosamine transferase [Minisyncoccia bacterium]
MLVKPNRKLRIFLAGGGTGGHIFPLIAVLRELKEKAQKEGVPLEIIYFGPKDFTFNYILKEKIIAHPIISGKLRRELNPLNLLDFLKLILGIAQSFFYFYYYMPDAVLIKGGYGSLPIAFWSSFLFIPLFIHESDAVPGLVNLIFKKRAKKIFLSFESALSYFPKEKAIVCGNPVRNELLNLPEKETTKKMLKIADRPVLTVIGGSQGAVSLNDLILDCLDRLLEKVEVIHQTGDNNFSKVQKEAEIVFKEIIKNQEKEKYYHLVPFFEEKGSPDFSSFRDVLAVTDLVVSRAGSGLIFEISACGLPSILIPYPYASKDHQRKNAYEYFKTGACLVLEEENLKPNIFTDLVFQIIFDEKRKKEMREKALSFSKPEAGKIIAETILNSIRI